MDSEIAKLRELAEKATPVLIHLDLMRYDHGGGRLAIMRDGERKLIADFYGDGADTEFYAAANPSTILALLDTLAAANARVAEVEAEQDRAEAAEMKADILREAAEVRLAEAEAVIAGLKFAMENAAEMAERPTYNDLEVGFRHSPLTQSEITKRYEETCRFIAADLRAALSPPQQAGTEGER